MCDIFILSTKTRLPETAESEAIMETILIMARALEKASTNYRIDSLDIQYSTVSNEYTGYVLLTWVDQGELNRDIQSQYMIKTDGTVKKLKATKND